jgi:hypothetical protein
VITLQLRPAAQTSSHLSTSAPASTSRVSGLGLAADLRPHGCTEAEDAAIEVGHGWRDQGGLVSNRRRANGGGLPLEYSPLPVPYGLLPYTPHAGRALQACFVAMRRVIQVPSVNDARVITGNASLRQRSHSKTSTTWCSKRRRRSARRQTRSTASTCRVPVGLLLLIGIVKRTRFY